MKKTYKLEDLGCAFCAGKMEEAIKNLPGVNEATVNFMTSKLKIEVEKEEDLENIIKLAQEKISKIEGDCKIVF